MTQYLVVALKDACEAHGEVNFRNDYSGRGMYGKRCVGIDSDMTSCMAIIGEVIKQCASNIAKDDPHAQADFEMAVDILLQFDRDSMGRDVILYWPDLQEEEEEVVNDNLGENFAD